METVTIDGVEIFRAGVWNDDSYSTRDLQQLVDNFSFLKDKVKPPIKLGHSEKQRLLKEEGLPAGGWITKLKLAGDKVLATISDVPKRLARLIKNRQYKRISAEIYPSYKSGDKTYNNVLRAVALLGGDIPAIDSLRDVEAMYTLKTFNDDQFFKTYDLQMKERCRMAQPFKTFTKDGVEYYQDSITGKTYPVENFDTYDEKSQGFLQTELNGTGDIESMDAEQLRSLVRSLQAQVTELQMQLEEKGQEE